VTLQAELTVAVERHEIVAWYQPQMDISSGLIVAVEALSRWQHPRLGLLDPDHFIELAEQTGLIGEIGRSMIESACHSAAAWRTTQTSLAVAVNVSAAQLATGEFFDDLVAMLHATGLPPTLLTIEITESRAIANREEAAVRLNRLRLLGITISIDDFGVGFSSLDQLLELPAAELKLDRSLIHGMVENSGSLMSVIVTLAHERGLRVVAEGIETAAHLELARDLGCDRVQGYLIGRPMPPHEVAPFLSGYKPWESPGS